MVKISLASGKKEVYPGAGAPGTPNMASPLVDESVDDNLLVDFIRF